MQKRAQVETITLPITRVTLVQMETKPEKPNAAQAGWIPLGTKIHFRNPVFTLREDEIELPKGKRKRFAYFERTDAVIVVPVTQRGEMVLINQYRYSIDEWCLEVPAGGTHDKPDESLEGVARAELREEVGGHCEAMTYVGCFYSATSITDEKCRVFLAENVMLSEAAQEAAESIKLQLLPLAAALQLVHAGEMKDGQCALAILLCEPLLRWKGYLAQQSR